MLRLTSVATTVSPNFPPAPAAPESWRDAIAPRLPGTLPPVTRAELADALAALVAATSPEDRVDGLVALAEWLRAGASPFSDPFSRGPDRIELLAGVLDGELDLRAAFHRAIAAVVAQPTGENPFGETGVPHRRGFLGEFLDRAMAYALPSPRDDYDLSRLLRRLFARDSDVEAFLQLTPAQMSQLTAVLFPADRAQQSDGLAASFADGFRLLATRVVAEGLGEELRARSPRVPVAESPFLRLARHSDELAATWQAGGEIGEAAAVWRSARAACRAHMAEVYRRLESEGVSIDIVFGLEVIDRCLTRLSLMLEVMEAPPGTSRAIAVHRLLGRLIVAVREDRSLTHLVRWNLRLLGRKIVDRAGETGEHYIAYSRDEYRHIWRAAAGGGLLTVGTAAVKLTLAGAGLALFQEGLLAGVNYAISFLLLQAFDLMLATKQPAMTGATLAAIFRERQGGDRLDEIVDFTARIAHSQLAAAIGNVTFVALGGVVFEMLWRAAIGTPFLDAEKAVAVQQSFNPLASGTVFYAAVTGVILFLASLVGGWFDNWSAVHRLPLAIREHPLGRHVGRERLRRVSEVWAHNAAGIGTSVSLGLMLGLMPSVGAFFGIPLDVRHVTLSAGQLALATAALWPGGGVDIWLVYGLAGLASMFVLNLSVSFVLAFLNAVRAYDLPAGDLLELWRRLSHRMATRPGEFLLPARTPFKMPADNVQA
jgi:site-specific recombinase